jgi:hypothetical protein
MKCFILIPGTIKPHTLALYLNISSRYQWVRDFRNAKEAKAFALEEEVGDVRI